MIKKKCPDPIFVKTSEHFARLCRFLYRDATVEVLSHDDERDHNAAEEFWSAVAEPLRIAASIDEIKAMPDVLEPGGSAMCGTAWDLEVAWGDLTSCYVLETTRFMWAWVAFEKLIDLVCADEKGRGRTGKAIAYLKLRNQLEPMMGLSEVTDFVSTLVEQRLLDNARSSARRSHSDQYL
jgi:hypothetical protein